MLVALSQAAPGGYHAAAPLVHAAAPLAHATYAAAPAVVGHSVQEHIHAGPAVHQTYHEVVGHRQVQVGTQAVQTGHTYTQQQSVSQAAPYTYVAGEPKTTQTTVPIAPPAIPAAPVPYAAIPPAPTNQVRKVVPSHHRLCLQFFAFLGTRPCRYRHCSKNRRSRPHPHQNHPPSDPH